MKYYPYNSPIILTDSLFLLYGGQTGTSSPATRNVAYLMAEEQMSDYLSALLLPTITTGTYFWRGQNPLELDYGHVIGILGVVINSRDWSNGCQVNTVSGCYAIRNDLYGYLDVNYFVQCGGCGSIVGSPPYNITVIQQSGLPSGTTYQPNMLQALTLVAQINLNELDIALSNESTADIGITSFSNDKYFEKRKAIPNTLFGNSPVAARAARLVKKLRAKATIGFH